MLSYFDIIRDNKSKNSFRADHLMKKIFLLLIITGFISAQVENVPIDHSVYTFLKEMELKKVIFGINEDIPNLSRAKIRNFLEEIESQQNELSTTEKALLEKFKVEFYQDQITDENTWKMFGESPNIFTSPFDVFSSKKKYLYHYEKDGNTVFAEMIGHFNYGQRFEPSLTNAELYDIGFRFRGTVADHLGYNLTVIKGGASGSRNFAPTIDPRLNYNFKFQENIENISNYDFVEGYLQYYTSPTEGMNLTAQIGREKMTWGYGYNSKLVMSGCHPMMDFIKFNFEYGIVTFTSIHASTVGKFMTLETDRYTKYFAMNRLKLSFENFADFGLGEVIVYSGRDMDIAYLNPLLFYKFAEMSLQDRDNGLFFLDVKTNFLKNIEFQGTFFLDENLIGHLEDLSRYSNKTAYQVNAMWYEAFGLSDLSLMAEYTKIRPYVYTHDNPKNTYTSYEQLVGHKIGPNADEIFLKAAYNLSPWVRPALSYSYIRKGNNVVDENGTLIKNVGGDVFQPYRYDVDPVDAIFLDGNRVNSTEVVLSIRVEPFRDIIFDISYNYISSDHVSEGYTDNLSYAQLLMTLQF